jgi:hypothetical protein
MRAPCSEPSYPMPLIGVRHHVIRYELTPVRLANALLQIGPFLIAQDIDAGASCFDLARIFGKLVLILFGPRGDLFQESLGRRCHAHQYTTRPSMVPAHRRMSAERGRSLRPDSRAKLRPTPSTPPLVSCGSSARPAPRAPRRPGCRRGRSWAGAWRRFSPACRRRTTPAARRLPAAPREWCRAGSRPCSATKPYSRLVVAEQAVYKPK